MPVIFELNNLNFKTHVFEKKPQTRTSKAQGVVNIDLESFMNNSRNNNNTFKIIKC